MIDFEKLGAFYLGRRVDAATGERTEEPILYDARDLTTHAVIIGMTGSGKTGLGIGMLEEAALDHVPVIAVDPKGDLGNLLLTFPSLEAREFRPWISERQATERGLDPDVARARETAAKVRADLEQLEGELMAEIDALDPKLDPKEESLDEILVRPRSTDVHVSRIGLLWMPYRDRGDGRLEPAWHAGAGAL